MLNLVLYLETNQRILFNQNKIKNSNWKVKVPASLDRINQKVVFLSQIPPVIYFLKPITQLYNLCSITQIKDQLTSHKSTSSHQANQVHLENWRQVLLYITYSDNQMAKQTKTHFSRQLQLHPEVVDYSFHKVVPQTTFSKTLRAHQCTTSVLCSLLLTSRSPNWTQATCSRSLVNHQSQTREPLKTMTMACSQASFENEIKSLLDNQIISPNIPFLMDVKQRAAVE